MAGAESLGVGVRIHGPGEGWPLSRARSLWSPRKKDSPTGTHTGSEHSSSITSLFSVTQEARSPSEDRGQKQLVGKEMDWGSMR